MRKKDIIKRRRKRYNLIIFALSILFAIVMIALISAIIFYMLKV